ncbi:hypothetical protein [uncultured Clostridium sp.]|uniref:hypothetical protein n=1 Tax=uncultured Clostridium sp. TaxID=59620 RepID=UPI0026702F2E|nr:hypothetical protein [uncultured Clostridium sp.]
MIKIENTIKDKVSQINSSNNVNQYLSIKLEQENNKDSKTTITKSKNQDIYKTIRKKASIINSDQRNIQDKISLIQAQEQKISQIENTLKYARKEYEQAIKSEKKEEVKQKIKIRQLSNKIDNLKNQSQEKQSKIEEINNDKEIYLEDEEKIINRINELLEKISNSKSQMSQYKAELIALSQQIESDKAKIKVQESELQKNLEDSDYIINNISISNYNYSNKNGNISTGIIIDIYI